MFNQNDTEKKLDWMYKGANSLIDREEYLLGRQVDKSLEQLNAEEKQKQQGTSAPPKNHVEHECIPPSIRDYKLQQQLAEQVDLQAKLQEDPLLTIKKREEETRRQFLQNPVQLKKLQKALSKQEKRSKKKKNKDLDESIIEKLKLLQNHSLDIDNIKRGNDKSEKYESKKVKKERDLDIILMHKFNALKNKLTENDLKDIMDGKFTDSEDFSSEEKESDQDAKRNRNNQKNGKAVDGRRNRDAKKRGRDSISLTNKKNSRKDKKVEKKVRTRKDSSSSSRDSSSDESSEEESKRSKRKNVKKSRRREMSTSDSSAEGEKKKSKRNMSYKKKTIADSQDENSWKRHKESHSSKMTKEDDYLRSKSRRDERKRSMSPFFESKNKKVSKSWDDREDYDIIGKRNDNRRDNRFRSDRKRSEQRFNHNRSSKLSRNEKYIKPNEKSSQDRRNKRSASTDEMNKYRNRSNSRDRSRSRSRDRNNRHIGPERPPSNYTSHSRPRHNSDDSDDGRPKVQNWGLVKSDGTQIPLSRSRRSRSRSRSRERKLNIRKDDKSVSKVDDKNKNDNKSSQQWRKRLTSEEKEKMIKEMIRNAEERDAERARNIKKYREDEAKEDQNREFNAEFARKEYIKSANSATVESRIKANLNNIQRGKSDMNSHFSRRH